MSSHSYNPNYQYKGSPGDAKGCFYCRARFTKITKSKIKFWEGNRVCDSCSLQLERGVKLTREGFFLKDQSPGSTRLCKMCNKTEIKRMYNNLYPKFCNECRIKFDKMVADDPK